MEFRFFTLADGKAKIFSEKLLSCKARFNRISGHCNVVLFLGYINFPNTLETDINTDVIQLLNLFHFRVDT
jgi:hypothetical protein